MIHAPSIVWGSYIISTYIVGSMPTSSHSWAHILALLHCILNQSKKYIHLAFSKCMSLIHEWKNVFGCLFESYFDNLYLSLGTLKIHFLFWNHLWLHLFVCKKNIVLSWCIRRYILWITYIVANSWILDSQSIPNVDASSMLIFHTKLNLIYFRIVTSTLVL